MNRLRVALATSAVLGMSAACGYGGDASGTDGGTVTEAGVPSADARADGAGIEGGPAPEGGVVTLLSVTSSFPATQVNLDTEGTLGWIHWGYDPDFWGNDPHRFVERASAKSVIPTYTDPGSSLDSFNQGLTTFVWTMGSGPAAGTDRTGVYVKDEKTFRLQMSASPMQQRLVLYVGSHTAAAQLTVTLGGAPPSTPVPPFGQPLDNNYIRYAIDYAAPEGTPLDVAWTMTGEQDFNSNVALMAATLSVTP